MSEEMADHAFCANCYAGQTGFRPDPCAWCWLPEEQHPPDGPWLDAKRGDTIRLRPHEGTAEEADGAVVRPSDVARVKCVPIRFRTVPADPSVHPDQEG